MGLAWLVDLTFLFNNAEASEAGSLLWEHNDPRVRPNLLQLRSLLAVQTDSLHPWPLSLVLRLMLSCWGNSAKELSTGRCSAGPDRVSHAEPLGVRAGTDTLGSGSECPSKECGERQECRVPSRIPITFYHLRAWLADVSPLMDEKEKKGGLLETVGLSMF